MSAGPERSAAESRVVLGAVASLPPGTVRMVRAGSSWVALANVAGTIHAVDNRCPHNGGPLGQGTLRGCELECPWHHWRWNLQTGRSVWPTSDWRLRRLPVTVEEGVIYVERT